MRAIIAGAGGAAALPGVLAAKTTLPVLGVPVPSGHLSGQDSLLSMVQMPPGIPVATFAIGEAGATNAALFAVALLAVSDDRLTAALGEYRAERRAAAAAGIVAASETIPAQIVQWHDSRPVPGLAPDRVGCRLLPSPS
jgi:5-(carboxyamino)imidazole ribonucleotide mutase